MKSTLKVKTILAYVLCFAILLQFTVSSYALDSSYYETDIVEENGDMVFPSSDSYYESSSFEGIIPPDTMHSVKEFKLSESGKLFTELKTSGSKQAIENSKIELSFEDIPDKSIITTAILKLSKKSGSPCFAWKLSDDTNWYIGEEANDGEIIEINITPSVKTAFEQGLDRLNLTISPFLTDNYTEDSADRAVPDGYVEFDSGRSLLTVNYTHPNAYRDHSSIVSLGTGQSVDLYTGEMTFSVLDASTNSPAFPVSICHNYSSLYGWRLNFDQSIVINDSYFPETVDYTDGFGKIHHLQFIDGDFTDTGGLGLIFSYVIGGYRITDKAGNALEFNESGKLAKVLDKSGNYAAVTRNAYGRISYVTDSFGRQYHFLYNLSTGKMSSVMDLSGRFTSFSYTNGNLSSVNYPDGSSVSFQYSNDKVSRIINPDGTKTGIVYSGNKLFRVNAIPSDSEAVSDFVKIIYNDNSTEIRDRTGLAQVYRLDEYGRVVCAYEKKYDENDQPVCEVPTGTVLYRYTDTKRTFSSRISTVGENYICNSDFSGNNEWVFHGTKLYDDRIFDGKYSIIGRPGQVKYIEQYVEDFDVPYGNTMIFSAWAKASSASQGIFRLKVEAWYTNGSHNDSETSFDKNYTDWQYAATAIKINKDLIIDHFNVILEYSNNGGTCYFDNTRLVCAPANEAEYEDRYEHVTIFGEFKTIYERVTTTDGIYTTVLEKDDNGDVLRQTVTDFDGNSFVSLFEYDSCRRLVKTQNERNIITEYTYNSVGMVTSQKTYYCYTFNPSYDTEPEDYFLNTTEYDQSGEFALGIGDSRSDDIQTLNTYDTAKCLLTSTTSPNGQVTSYSYNSDNDLLTSVTSTLGNDVFTVTYGYDNAGRVTSVTHNGFVYGFTYDTLGRNKAFSIAGTTYCENSYELTDVTVVTTEYASGESVTVETDRNGMPVKTTYTDSEDETTVVSEAEYDDLGNLITLVDSISNIEYTYEYDGYGHVTREKRDNDPYKLFTYDSSCRLERTSRENESYIFIYDSKAGVIYPDNSITGVTLSGKYTNKITKDHYGRKVSGEVTLASAQAPLIENELTYISVYDADETRLTGYPETFRTLVNGTEISRYTYTYDNNGNITGIYSSGNLIIRYVYDGMNRLIREDNSILSNTYTYSYDTAGNILEKSRYPFTTSTLTAPSETKLYTYPSSGWKDLLISYDGIGIIYDDLGNPTSYKGHTLSWGMVRQLEAYDQNTFEYNSSGIRIRKNGTEYELDGTTIVEERRNGTIIRYRYGVEGLVGFSFNGTDYYYTKDLFGNISGIYRADGTKYAAYEYDAWGNHIVTLDLNGIGTVNPFRYRGYYYDTETGLYYLQSRYYDPETGRFISADAQFDRGFEGRNLFCYCGNNPVSMVDSTGRFSEWILLGLFTILAATLFSCDRLLPNAPPDYIEEYSTAQNCYSYAFGLPVATNPGLPAAMADSSSATGLSDYFGRDPGRIYTMEEMITFIKMDMKHLGIPIRIVDSPNDRLDDEYIVAVNISNTFLPDQIFADYHFAVMLSDGTWADKPGQNPSRWNAFDATQHAWDFESIVLGTIKGYYNVGPKYIAVKRGK